ncbi:hypothetical protein ACA910_001099 [Epithemia clementina (nom. ined.)]
MSSDENNGRGHVLPTTILASAELPERAHLSTQYFSRICPVYNEPYVTWCLPENSFVGDGQVPGKPSGNNKEFGEPTFITTELCFDFSIICFHVVFVETKRMWRILAVFWRLVCEAGGGFWIGFLI